MEWEDRKEGDKEKSAAMLRNMELEHECLEKEKERVYNSEQKEKECKFAEEQATKDRELAKTKYKQELLRVCLGSGKPVNEIRELWDLFK